MGARSRGERDGRAFVDLARAGSAAFRAAGDRAAADRPRAGRHDRQSLFVDREVSLDRLGRAHRHLAFMAKDEIAFTGPTGEMVVEVFVGNQGHQFFRVRVFAHAAARATINRAWFGGAASGDGSVAFRFNFEDMARRPEDGFDRSVPGKFDGAGCTVAAVAGFGGGRAGAAIPFLEDAGGGGGLEFDRAAFGIFSSTFVERAVDSFPAVAPDFSAAPGARGGYGERFLRQQRTVGVDTAAR